uniref:Uncharacterized protein n=1 Tax=Anguilla anguilla TaxID=7936 RepID=A0A0E9SG97_ANGAN
MFQNHEIITCVKSQRAPICFLDHSAK